jgi:hypothetical protein
MDYLVKIRSIQTPQNGQFSIGANKWLVLIGLYTPRGHISGFLIGHFIR